MRRHERAILVAIFFLGGAVMLCVPQAGCILAPRFSSRPRLAFPHPVHLEEKLDCSDCHTKDDETGDLGRTSPQVCRLCHEKLESPQLQPDALLGDFYDEADSPRGPYFLELAAEINFDHVSHMEYLPCAACHEGVIEGDSIGDEDRLNKPECMGCHTRMGAPNDCESCHSEIRTTTIPVSHGQSWLYHHGQIAEMERDRCSLCHLEQGGVNSCTGCHLTMPPRNHTEPFKRRNHGLLATMDRSTCQTCHTTDFCTTCHESIQPTSHRASFGSPRNTHCLGCHFPLSSEPSCRVCHLSAPSHANGAPQPPGHIPGANCRACHGFGAPLPHVDNGSSCEACHP